MTYNVSQLFLEWVYDKKPKCIGEQEHKENPYKLLYCTYIAPKYKVKVLFSVQLNLNLQKPEK